MHDSRWARADGVIAQAGLPNFSNGQITDTGSTPALIFPPSS